MSSLDELLLFSSAALCTIKRSSETRYGFIHSLFVQLRREAGRNFMSGYYKPETLPYMFACRDAAVAGSMAAGVRRQCDFGISRYVPDEAEPLVSVHVRLSKRARYMELARAVCGTVRGAGLRKGASAQAVQDAWHR